MAYNGLVLEISRLTRDFDGLRAVDDLSLSVEEGEFFGIVGPNGAGKSTTLNMVTGLLKPTSGGVRVFGMDPYKRGLEVKARIGVVPEDVPMHDRLTGREALEFAARIHLLDPKTSRNRARDLMAWLGLEEAGGSLIVDYSQGMRKKVAIGCALIHRPRLLFLDEPFSGIDPISVKAIKDVLNRMVGDGTTIIFSSHVMELVERLCSRVAILNKGRLLASGSLGELRISGGLDKGATLEEVFVDAVGGNAAKDAGWLVS